MLILQVGVRHAAQYVRERRQPSGPARDRACSARSRYDARLRIAMTGGSRRTHRTKPLENRHVTSCRRVASYSPGGRLGRRSRILVALRHAQRPIGGDRVADAALSRLADAGRDQRLAFLDAANRHVREHKKIGVGPHGRVGRLAAYQAVPATMARNSPGARPARHAMTAIGIT